MRTHCSTLTNTVAEVEAEAVGDTRGDAHALVNTLAHTVAEVESMKLGEAHSNAHALVELWLTRLRRWRQ